MSIEPERIRTSPAVPAERKPPRMPVSECSRCGAKVGEYCKPGCAASDAAYMSPEARLRDFLDQFIDGEDPEGREQALVALAAFEEERERFNGVSSLYARTLRQLRAILRAWGLGDVDAMNAEMLGAFLGQFGKAPDVHADPTAVSGASETDDKLLTALVWLARLYDAVQSENFNRTGKGEMSANLRAALKGARVALDAS